MNPVEVFIIELIQMAETPLYSTYAALRRDFGSGLSLHEFLRLTQRLMNKQRVRAWQTTVSGERHEIVRLPPDLARAYAEAAVDADHDPFALSLTVGDAVSGRPVPEWTVDLDFRNLRFQVRAALGVIENPVSALQRLFPGYSFKVGDARRQGDYDCIVGSISTRETKS